MSDLSWLNPTPHTIAVYASSPLSPATTQHSLPSGRYPLLGPDFHRLDRTSLRLAHSLDHLVGPGEQRRRDFEPERLCRLEIDRQFILDRRLHRQVGRLLALEDAIHVACRVPKLVDESRPIGDQAAANDEVACEVNRGQFVSGRQRDDQIAMNRRQSASRYDQAAIRGTREGRDSALDLASVTHIDRGHLRPDRWRYGLDDTQLATPR